MKIAILWPQLSGYINACLRELAALPGVSLFVSYAQAASQEAPYRNEQFGWIENFYLYSEKPDASVLLKKLEAFQPDALLIISWNVAAYRQVAKAYRGRAVRILFMDNPWSATAKQVLGIAISRWYVLPLYDAVFLCGERQADFARRLGFRESQIRRGGYSCDHATFAAVHQARLALRQPVPEAFLFTGRLVAAKAVDVLAQAYRLYRQRCANSWPLVVCGTGPLGEELGRIEGVTLRGFVQPADLPAQFQQAGCLLLPSRDEHWGVVIHEAAAAGIGIICTYVCGASPHLVLDGYNGYTVAPNAPEDLAEAMARYSALSPNERRQIGLNSHTLSWQFTPQRWAAQLHTLSLEAGTVLRDHH